jgi:hypothetical protein
MIVASNAKLLGSGTVEPTGVIVVCEEKLFTVAVPSRLRFIVAANPSVRSDVKVGIVPALQHDIGQTS